MRNCGDVDFSPDTSIGIYLSYTPPQFVAQIVTPTFFSSPAPTYAVTETILRVGGYYSTP